MKAMYLMVAGLLLARSVPVAAAEADTVKKAPAAPVPAKRLVADKPALGMSVTGTQEAPKVLNIVPWKTLDAVPAEPYVSSLMDEVFAPVDQVVFERGVHQFDQRQQQQAPSAVATEQK